MIKNNSKWKGHDVIGENHDDQLIHLTWKGEQTLYWICPVCGQDRLDLVRSEMKENNMERWQFDQMDVVFDVWKFSLEIKDRDVWNAMNVEKYKIIKGRAIYLEGERAPSFYNETLKLCAREYYVHQITSTLKYLISDEIINEKFWYRANYSSFMFKYEGESVHLSTNHGSERCMNEVINGKLDISDWILDLSCLLGIAVKDEEERDEFKKKIQKRTKDGIERKVKIMDVMEMTFKPNNPDIENIVKRLRRSKKEK